MKSLARLVAPLAAILPLLPATAQIAEAADQREVVRYDDLDLGRPEGVRALDRRLRTAIERACGSVSPTDPVGARLARECRSTLRAEVAGPRARLLAGLAPDASIVVARSR